MSAVATPLQAVPSTTVTFNVIIVDMCGTDVISFTAPAAITYSITTPLLSTAFAVATDSISTGLAIAESCGPFTYTNIEAYPWMTVNSVAATIDIYSILLTDANVYTATLEAALTNYPAATPI
jgi:hypothetical protein